MTTSQSRRCLFLFPLIALLLAPRPASAQFSGAIQGTILDSQKAVVAEAIVMVTHTASGVTREATTSPEGVFRVLSLGPGMYRVQVVKPGFVTVQRDAVNVGISETVRLDFTLEVSGVAESVTVTTTAPLVETEQGRVSGRVDRLQLQEMPLSGRNLYNLIALQPGVTGKGVSASISGGGGADDSFAGESAPRINASGQRDEANSFTVDDTSTNGVARGGIHQPDAQYRIGRRSARGRQQLLRGGRPQYRRADSGDHQGRDQPLPGQRLVLFSERRAVGQERLRNRGSRVQQESVRL
jgi:hypothetical protein